MNPTVPTLGKLKHITIIIEPHPELVPVNSQVAIAKASVHIPYQLSCAVATKLLHFTLHFRLFGNQLLTWMAYWRTVLYYELGKFVSYLTMPSLQILTMSGTRLDVSCANASNSHSGGSQLESRQRDWLPWLTCSLHSSVTARKFWDSTFNYTTTAPFHTLISHSTIQHYCDDYGLLDNTSVNTFTRLCSQQWDFHC